jgi:single-strand DNA-binding protein
MNLNKVTLIGRLTKEPEMKFTASGKEVTKFTVATNHKSGEKEYSTFHNIVTWGTLAENCKKYLVKGQEVYVEGRIDYRTRDKDDGTKGYITEIVANDVKFGAKPNGSKPSASTEAEEAPVVEDDIPF